MTGSVEERVASLAVQILSDTFLEQVVDEVGLVPSDADRIQRASAARRREVVESRELSARAALPLGRRSTAQAPSGPRP